MKPAVHDRLVKISDGRPLGRVIEKLLDRAELEIDSDPLRLARRGGAR